MYLNNFNLVHNCTLAISNYTVIRIVVEIKHIYVKIVFLDWKSISNKRRKILSRAQ